MANKKYKTITNIIYFTLTIAFFEIYIGNYIYHGFYNITARYYFVIEAVLTILLFTENRIGKYEKLYFSIIITTVLSSLFNFVTFSQLIYYLKLYIFPIAFAIWTIRINENKIFKYLLILYFLNLILNIGWLLKINPLPNNYLNNWADFAIGTVGSTYFAFLSIIFIVIFIVYNKRIKLLLSFFGLLISNSFTLIGISIPVILSIFKIKLKHIFLSILLIILVFFSAKYLLNDIYYKTTQRFKIISKMNFTKFELYYQMIDNFTQKPYKLAFGFGPGERTSYSSEETKSEFYQKYVEGIAKYYNIRGGSIMDKYYSGISSILWETGLINLILIIALLFYILIFENKNIESKRINFAVLILFILWNLVMDQFRHNNLIIITFIILGTLSKFDFKKNLE